MATCKNCGKPLIVNKGKCIYCGAEVASSTQDIPVEQPKSGIKKSRPIIQRRSFVNQGGQSPYSQYAGQSIISGARTDRFGNPQGSQYDLAKDGAFKGYKVVVLTGLNIMANASSALQRKGFSTKILGYSECNDVKRIRNELNDDKCQLWLISGDSCVWPSDCFNLIYDHFNRGRGLYIWSDNEPFYADSNVILEKLFRSKMSGNYEADQVLNVQTGLGLPGIIKNHPITTGLQNFYEGITISNVKLTQDLKPLVYSSDGKIVTAYYDKDGKRVLIDGGFTRLYCKWDSAGTDRFVVNCAAWLANIERFGYHPE